MQHASTGKRATRLFDSWRLLLLLFAVGLRPLGVWAQVVTTAPVFFRETDPVTITFDATQGNGALNNFTGNVYIWTGVVTNQSATNTTWRYVRSPSFGAADPAALMTRSSTNPNIYTITLSPSVRAFYPALPAGETVRRLGMLFKNDQGTVVGRSDSGGDIFIDVWQGQFAVRITDPAASPNPRFVPAGSSVSVTAAASAASNMAVTLNGTPQTNTAGTTSITANVTLTQPGRNVVRVTGQTPADLASDSVVFIVRPAVTTAPLPAAVVADHEDGVTYVSPTSAILVLTAPNKQFVYAMGEWNGFQPTDAGYMNRTPDGNRWWVQVNGLTAGQEYAYQYLVDGDLRVADPYAAKILDPDNDRFITAVNYPNLKPYPTGQTTGIVSILQTNQPTYTWTTTGYQRPKETDLVVYEMLVRDFVALRNYQAVRDTLDYLQRLGITAIELMPVNEFEGNDSWGYNGSFHLALDKAYGTPDAFKQFIDECHRRGIAVIVDVVLNHAFGQNSMVRMYWDAANNRPATNSPWFNPIAKHDFNVGYDFNHESDFTKYYTKRVISYWLEEYHVDGYRFDLSKGFTQRNTLGNNGAWGQFDQSRIDIWKDYADHMWGVDSTSYLILEHFADNSEELQLANYRRGMMPWGNAHGATKNASTGFVANSDFSWGLSYKTRGWAKPRLMGYSESHDEERLMYENLQNGNTSQAANGYNVRTLATALARQEAIAAFVLAVPGPKMFWQFGEVGYDVSINQNGRTGSKPIRWQYYQDANRRKLYEVYRAMLYLRRHPAFESTNFAWVGPGNSIKTLRIVDPSMSVMVIANFAVVGQTANPNFPQTGIWYDHFRRDSLNVAANPVSIPLAPGEYRVYTSVRQPLPNGSVLSVADDLTTATAGLSAPQAFPNPSAGSPMTIAYELARPATVRATVLDVLGRPVTTFSERQDAGFQTLTWAPTATVAPGTYMVRLRADNGPARTVRVVVQ